MFWLYYVFWLGTCISVSDALLRSLRHGRIRYCVRHSGSFYATITTRFWTEPLHSTTVRLVRMEGRWITPSRDSKKQKVAWCQLLNNRRPKVNSIPGMDHKTRRCSRREDRTYSASPTVTRRGKLRHSPLWPLYIMLYTFVFLVSGLFSCSSAISIWRILPRSIPERIMFLFLLFSSLETHPGVCEKVLSGGNIADVLQKASTFQSRSLAHGVYSFHSAFVSSSLAPKVSFTRMSLRPATSAVLFVARCSDNLVINISWIHD